MPDNLLRLFGLSQVLPGIQPADENRVRVKIGARRLLRLFGLSWVLPGIQPASKKWKQNRNQN